MPANTKISIALFIIPFFVCVCVCHVGKLDLLGEIFKRNVDAVKSWPQIDLIFLVDASSSVGEENFISEIRFVRKLLSDLIVSHNHTKIALITFASKESIITHVNDITNANETNKCVLLNEFLPNIKYSGGGTYTLGAFEEAKRIIENSSRNNTKKAIFLITDGFSNGGDPIPVSNSLKEDYDVTVFTIGIKTGRSEELQNLSSNSETCYLLNGFKEFESLARRALHADLQDGQYIPVAVDKCGGACHAENAECTCGTGSGQYTCKCRRGFYGDGIDCEPCPNRTWFRAEDGVCLSCPDPNHESHKALSPDECKCKQGYKDYGFGKCEVVRCPELEAPKNGYFVGVPTKTAKCQNVLNNACGVRCQVGYNLRGNSIRLCQVNETWSGIEPQCVIKTCTKPASPPHGQIIKCTNSDLDVKYDESEIPNDMTIDTECTFKCEKGYSMTGSAIRTCLPINQWDGIRTNCKPVRCNRLSKVAYGHWEPETCGKDRQSFGSRCALTCKKGFQASGDFLTCNSVSERGAGKWVGNASKCIDIEPPIIKCPAKYIQIETLSGAQIGIANWSKVEAFDNSGADVFTWTEPFGINEMDDYEFEIGNTSLTFYAIDGSGNKASCSMIIEVIDKEPPIIDNCDSPPPFLTSDPSAVNIQWDEPLAYDNSQGPINMTRSHNFGIFPAGTTEVIYTATDMFNNSNSCVLNITVIPEANCDTPPIEGSCTPTTEGITCAITCQEGYGFALTDKAICLHETPGIWDIPECTPTETPTNVWQVINSEENCSDNKTIYNLENIVKEDGGMVLITGCERTKRSAGDQQNLRRIEYRLKDIKKFMETAQQIGINVTIGQPIINCKNGSVPAFRQQNQKFRCVLCPKGTYFANKRCIACPVDTFSDKPGSFICESCPSGRSTLNKKRSKSKRACKALCPKDTEKLKNNTCEKRIKKRISCDRPNVCKNGGSCVPVGKSRHKCICAPGWVGARCRVREKKCVCQNGGSCVNDLKCICPQGFYGDSCEFSELDVEQEDEEEVTTLFCKTIDGLCENNSTCIDKPNGTFECICSPGYLGKRCNILPCDYNPCSENTICKNLYILNATKQSYECQCPKGMINPPNCSVPINYCESFPCFNGGTCISVSYNYICKCNVLFYGLQCEFLKDSNYILHFPRSGIHDFVIVDGPTTNLSEVTMCSWIQTNDKGNYGTVLSYATTSFDNAFTVTDYSGLVLYVNGQYIVTDVRLNDGFWHHLCVNWNALHGAYNIYVDSKLQSSGTGLSDGTQISGNGKIVLGQEQDILGGRFSRAESFIGKLSNLDLWNKSLTENEVRIIMQACSTSEFGNIRTWAEFKNNTRGFVNIEDSTFCGNCPAPNPIENGNVIMDTDHQSAFYSCDEGFILIFEGKEFKNNLKRKCTAASQWEGFEDPKCEPVSCPYPGYVPYARVIGRFYNIRYKDKLIYYCYPGYEPSEPQIRTCTENGTWSGTKPICRGEQCESFPKPDNINITIISEHVYDEEFENIDLFEIGTQLQVFCLNDAILQGPEIIFCQENGTWNAGAPKCEIPGCLAKEMPTIPANSYTLGEISGVTFDVGTIISFKCRNGYNQIGNNFTECLTNGKWKMLNMSCSPIECIDPTFYENMHVKNNLDVKKYYFGNTLSYECNEGYKFYGVNSVKCLSTGKWTKLKGKCGRISCSKPNVSVGETIIGNSYLFKDSLTVMCPNGATNANYNLTCTKTGKWSQDGDCNSARKQP